MENRVYFSQRSLDEWLSDGKVDLQGSDLTIVEQGRRYAIEEALYFVKEVTGAPDQQNLLGRVKPKRAMEEKGAEVFDTSCILGDNAYDVVPGWLGLPIGTYEDHKKARSSFPDEPSTDEDLLARLILKSLR